MAIEVITAVLALPPEAVTPTERLVLIVMGYRADKHGRDSFQAVPTIAKRSSLTRRAVQKALRRLAEKGFLEVAGRRSRGALNYSIRLAALRHREPRSQSDTQDRERGSQSTPLRTTFTPGANDVLGGGEPRSQKGRTTFARSVLDPSSDPSVEKNAALRASPAPQTQKADEEPKDAKTEDPDPEAPALTTPNRRSTTTMHAEFLEIARAVVSTTSWPLKLPAMLAEFERRCPAGKYIESDAFEALQQAQQEQARQAVGA
jgi:hypothetical protein